MRTPTIGDLAAGYVVNSLGSMGKRRVATLSMGAERDKEKAPGTLSLVSRCHKGGNGAVLQ